MNQIDLFNTQSSSRTARASGVSAMALYLVACSGIDAFNGDSLEAEEASGSSFESGSSNTEQPDADERGLDLGQGRQALSANATWTPFPELTNVAQIRATTNLDGSLALFTRTHTGAISFAKQASPNAGWPPAVALGGTLLQDFAVAPSADGRLGLFALGGDGAIYYQWQTAPNSSSWSGWHSGGGHSLRDVAVARQADGRVRLLAVGADGYIYEQLQAGINSTALTGWSYIGGPGVTRLELATQASGRLAVLGLTASGEMMLGGQSVPNSAFLGWTTIFGTALTDYDVARNSDGRLEVVAIGGDSHVYYQSQLQADRGWGGWQAHEAGPITDLDLISGAQGELHLFMVGPDGLIYHSAQNGPSAGYIWHADLGGGSFQRVDAERNTDGRLEVFALSAAGEVYGTWESRAGSNWEDGAFDFGGVFSGTFRSNNGHSAGATLQLSQLADQVQATLELQEELTVDAGVLCGNPAIPSTIGPVQATEGPARHAEGSFAPEVMGYTIASAFKLDLSADGNGLSLQVALDLPSFCSDATLSGSFIRN